MPIAVRQGRAVVNHALSHILVLIALSLTSLLDFIIPLLSAYTIGLRVAIVFIVPGSSAILLLQQVVSIPFIYLCVRVLCTHSFQNAILPRSLVVFYMLIIKAVFYPVQALKFLFNCMEY